METRLRNTSDHPGRAFAQVAVDGAGGQDRTFTYRVPEEMEIAPGHLVWVPFGSRVLQGVVLALVDTPEVEQTRDIERVAYHLPLLSSQQINVIIWMAEYYRVGLFLAAVQMLPPGFASRLRTWVSLDSERASEPAAISGLNGQDQRALRILEDAGEVRKPALARSIGRGGRAVVDRLINRKLLLTRTDWELKRQKPLYTRLISLALESGKVEKVAQELDALPRMRGLERASLLRRVIDAPGSETQADLAREFGRSRVNWAKRSGLLRVEEVRVDRNPLRSHQFETTTPLEPTVAQTGAIRAITSALQNSSDESVQARKFLLYGVTGSGKTEVYLRAAEKCLELGRSVLILVPEIALTPQTLSRFASRFPGQVALLHSGLQPGERFDQWWRVANGDFPIVLGSRSAVFAPLKNLGLVMIDEEHEWTYKQHDPAPRYHARAVAERFCAEHGAVLVVGSATPDIETFRRAERGEVDLLRLPGRVGIGTATGNRNSLTNTAPARTSAGQAAVTIVDMREELRNGNSGSFSRVLLKGIRDSLETGGRVILFLNRRGSAAYVQCRTCGSVRSCRRCDTSLTMHRSDMPDGIDSLVCHYCGYRVRPGNRCGECNAEDMRPMGIGTQSVVADVERQFPGVRWRGGTEILLELRVHTKQC